jgi:L-alanine-DL-glutamate epimerase-like enolase superfamily enzyme
MSFRTVTSIIIHSPLDRRRRLLRLHSVDNQMRCVSRFHRVALLLMCASLLAGCGETHPNDPVRPEIARETLEAALTAWKEDRTAESLQQQSPAIVVQDADWMTGARLTSFRLLDDGKVVGANLSIEVELNLVDPQGKSRVRNVWYLVGTDPALTVFRDMFH